MPVAEAFRTRPVIRPEADEHRSRCHGAQLRAQPHEALRRRAPGARIPDDGARRDELTEVRLETAPGGHLGVLTGMGARDTTWRYLDEFLAEHDPVRKDGAKDLSHLDARPAAAPVPALARHPRPHR